MNKRLSFIVSIALIVLPVSAESYTARDSVNAYSGVPKIGLTFAGGGAKGAAHIGVLRLMEEVGIPVDYVCGTSMGGILGALVSLGYDSKDIEEIITNVDWNTIMSDNMERKGIQYEQKTNLSKYQLLVPFGKTNDQKKEVREEEDGRTDKERGLASLMNTLPGGFIEGSNVLNLFNSLSIGYQDSIDFNTLPIPFACVASDIVSGDSLVLRSGRLPEAMRSSMAIPGVFAPFKYDEDKILVDGGLFNNFPVDVCQSMGADIIIGVEVTKDRKTQANEVNTLPELITRLFDMMTRKGTEANRERCTIYVHPNIEGFNTLSFDPKSIKEIIKRGYDAANEQRELFVALRKELDKYGVPYKTQYRNVKAKNISPISDERIEIESICIEGVQVDASDWLLKRSHLKGIQTITGRELSEAISIWKGTGAFNSVIYYLSDIDGNNRYELTIKTTPSKKSEIGLSVRYDTEESAALLFRFGLNQNVLQGFKIGATAKLNYNPRFALQTSYSPLFFPTINLDFKYRGVNSVLSVLGHDTFNITYNQYKAELYLSQFNTRFIDFALGSQFTYFDATDIMSKVSSQYLNFEDSKMLGIFARLNFDNLDDGFYPSKGSKFSINGDYIFKDFVSTDPTVAVQLSFETFIPIGRKFVLSPKLYARGLPSINTETLTNFLNVAGGHMSGRYFDQQIPVVGFISPEVMSNYFAVARLDARLNIFNNHYISGKFNIVRDSETIRTEISSGQKTILGASLEYAINTIIGPVSLSFEWSDFKTNTETTNTMQRMGLYFSYGYSF